MTVLLLLIVFLPMLVEFRRASRNERAQRARGGVEPVGDVHGIMQVVYPGAFLAMILESALRGDARPDYMIVGAVVFAAAKALKWWAILSLGPFWTFRVIVIPGATLVARGPYRVVRHPNYVAVVGELLGVGLMTGAVLAGPLAGLIFGALLMKRIAVEDRALRQHGGAAPDVILR